MTIMQDAADLAALAADIPHEHRYDIRVELCQRSGNTLYWCAQANGVMACGHSKWTSVIELCRRLQEAEK